VNTSDARLRRAYHDHMQAQRTRRDRLLRLLGVDSIVLHTHEDFTPRLHKFFQERARRLR
jgi:hypothetical protein